MVGLFVAFALLSLGFGAIERLWPARSQPRWRRGVTTDLAYWLVTPFVSRALAAAAVMVVAVVVAKLAGVPLDQAHVAAFIHRSSWFAGQPRAIQVVEILVVGDLLGYWIHRAFHARTLWRFHAIHHSSVDLDWLSATRLHPVNDMVQRALQAVPLFALGFDPTIVAAYVPILTLYAIAVHANVTWSFGPLRYVIVSPTFHRWHHTSQEAGLDKNFAGLLPVWDLLFGTFYMPRGELPRTFGVTDPVPPGLLGQLVWPLRQPRRRATGPARRA